MFTLLPIIVGVVVVIIASVIGEMRVAKERVKSEELQATIELKDAEIKKKISVLQEINAKIEQAIKLDEKKTAFINELSTASVELAHDYSIVVGLLEDEIGKEEAYSRYIAKKNEAPKDINELFKELKGNNNE